MCTKNTAAISIAIFIHVSIVLYISSAAPQCQLVAVACTVKYFMNYKCGRKFGTLQNSTDFSSQMHAGTKCS